MPGPLRLTPTPITRALETAEDPAAVAVCSELAMDVRLNVALAISCVQADDFDAAEVYAQRASLGAAHLDQMICGCKSDPP